MPKRSRSSSGDQKTSKKSKTDADIVWVTSLKNYDLHYELGLHDGWTNIFDSLFVFE